jgi:hypothetical protein
MFSIEYFLIAVFSKVDELVKEITQTHRVREKGFAPALKDLLVWLSRTSPD